MDAPSAQLALDIRAAVQDSFSTRRPLLHHLNADTSWFLQIPRPQDPNLPTRLQRHWFNILIDPWLSGSQSDVASWFSQQWHSTECKVPSIGGLEELAQEIEILSGKLRSEEVDDTRGSKAAPSTLETLIDVLAISHEFSDHCHKATLLQCTPSTPVIATGKAAKLIRSWNHFETVLETPSFPCNESKDWRHTAITPLPEWLGIARLISTSDVLYYHSALLFTFDCTAVSHESPQADGAAEAVIYTPHGIYAEDLAVIKEASPPIRTLAFLHGLHEVTVSGKQLNLGAHNGLKAQRILQAKYWIGTHDEVKKAGGLVKWALGRRVISVKEALGFESARDSASNGSAVGELEDVSFLDLDNGASTVLI